MAQTQVKPKTGGSWNNVTGKGKDTPGIVGLPGYQATHVLLGAALYASSGGQGTRAAYAQKLAGVGNLQFQWA